MLQSLTIASLLFVTAVAAAQGGYRSGFLLDAEGGRTEVEILNQDWVDNPQAIQYRTARHEKAVTATVGEIAGFGLADGSLRYLRFTVALDESDQRTATLSTSTTPVFVNRTVFLETLVEGRADLFSYEQGERRQFFYRIGDEPPRLLVSRVYRAAGNSIKQDNSFRGELSRSLDCGGLNRRLTDLAYTRRALVAYVNDYNSCGGQPSTTFTRASGKAKFAITLLGGVEWGKLDVSIEAVRGFERVYALEQQLRPRVGIEFELRLPFANNRWALFTGANYHGFRDEDTEQGGRTLTAFYRSVNVPMGARRYFPVGKESTGYLNAALVIDTPVRSSITEFSSLIDYHYPLDWTPGLELGAGVGVRGRYRLQLVYAVERTLTNFRDIRTRYGYFAFVGGYRLVGGWSRE